MGDSGEKEALESIKSLIQDMMAKHSYKGAIFYANKLAVISGYHPTSVYLLANALFIDNQYRRCLHILERRNMVNFDVRFRLLAARCLVATAAWEDCITLLQGHDAESLAALPYSSTEDHIPGSKVHVMSMVGMLLGQSFENLENFGKAVMWYKEALKCDPYNVEAFDMLMAGSKMSGKEEEDYLKEIQLPEEAGWLQVLYTSMCQGQTKEQEKKVRRALDVLEGSQFQNTTISGGSGQDGRGNRNKVKASTRLATRSRKSRFSPIDEEDQSLQEVRMPSGWNLAQDSDVVASRASILMKEGKYNEAHLIARAALERDSYSFKVLPIYLTVAVKLRKKNEIFLLGHKLMDQNPESAEAWYAAGCYYYVTQQFSSARQYFGKATTLNKMFAPAWIGFAHSFASMDETDQAMAAYRTAARLFPGLYEPILGMSLEYAKMNNMALAEEMARIARGKHPNEPIVLHEMGTLAYKNARYEDARKILSGLVDLLEEQVTVNNAEAEDIREVALVNLGHTYRKLKMWDQALDVLTRARSLEPYQPGTHSAIAYTYHLMGKPEEAVENYHKALSLRPEEPFSTAMLNIALEESSSIILDKLEDFADKQDAMES